MATDLTGLFDTYGRRARLYPALLTLASPMAAIFAWAPALIEGHSIAGFIGTAASFGLIYALASISRTAGKRAEKRLIKKWGGWPSTIMLRHCCADVPAATKARYHHFLGQSGSWSTPHVPEPEDSDPTANDDAYTSAVQWLKEQRRGSEFRLVHIENAEYGFRRNMRGLKTSALLLCLLAFVGWWATFFWQLGRAPWWFSSGDLGHVLTTAPPLAWAALVLSITAAVAWTILVTDGWVREAADQYAQALLATCDTPVTASVRASAP